MKNKNSEPIVCDTSVFISERVGDFHRDKALALIETTSSPILVSRLNRLEFTTVICRLEGEGNLTAVQARDVLHIFEKHIDDGILRLVETDEARLWNRALALGKQYSGTLFVRSLDVLQVALALEIGARTFWSFDAKQRKLAEAVGLTINP
ncbi:type II toxin-antitoxin system VapC family toxin [Luteolibacter algae]|uniref:Type II toxin-antitoxin system VapC family toxin n=1 Tax=Luteolibacter algae TaxID=454151 RepID=A0ABW5D6K2_9BACT